MRVLLFFAGFIIFLLFFSYFAFYQKAVV